MFLQMQIGAVGYNQENKAMKDGQAAHTEIVLRQTA